jgi:hypothetical protein
MPKGDQSLPPELEWEKMQEGIFQKMEEIKAAEATDSGRSVKSKIRTWGLAILLILLPVFCARFVFNPFQERAEVTETQQENSTLPGPGQGAKATTAAPQSPSPDEPSVEMEAQASMIDPSVITSETIHSGLETSNPLSDKEENSQKKGVDTIQPNPLNIYTDGQNTPSSTPPASQPKYSTQAGSPEMGETGQKSTKSSSGTIKMSDGAINDSAMPGSQASSFSNVTDEQVVVADRKATPTGEQLLPQAESLLPVLKIREVQPAISYRTLPAGSSAETERMEAPKEQRSAPTHQLVITSGFSTWSENYTGALPERAAYEQTLPSYHIQVNCLRTLDKGFLFMGGVQYQQLQSRFERVFDLDNYSITLQDTITHLFTNVLTGQQSITRGDVDVKVTAERRIRHYNNIQLYQIPIAVGKSWSYQKWQAYALVGGSLNVYTMNTGRTVYEGDVLDYSDTSTPFLKNQWKFNAQFTWRLSYRLADQLSVLAGVQFQKSLSDWSTEQNVQMRPGIINYELGLSYSIGK